MVAHAHVLRPKVGGFEVHPLQHFGAAVLVELDTLGHLVLLDWGSGKGLLSDAFA